VEPDPPPPKGSLNEGGRWSALAAKKADWTFEAKNKRFEKFQSAVYV
jgi:hypothetical protein